MNVLFYTDEVWGIARKHYNLAPREIKLQAMNVREFAARTTYSMYPGRKRYTILFSTFSEPTKDTVEHEVAHVVCAELGIAHRNHPQEYMEIYYKIKELMANDS